MLGIVALLIAAPLASDLQNVVPAVASLMAVGILVFLHPARRELIRTGSGVSVPLASIAVLGAIPLAGYALSMAAQARDLAGPPHHTQRLSTMAVDETGGSGLQGVRAPPAIDSKDGNRSIGAVDHGSGGNQTAPYPGLV